MTRRAHELIGDLRAIRNLERLEAYRRSRLHHTGDGRSEDDLGDTFPPLPSQATLDASSGAWKHPPRRAKRPGVIRYALGLIAAIVALWAFAAFANETLRAVAACGAC